MGKREMNHPQISDDPRFRKATTDELWRDSRAQCVWPSRDDMPLRPNVPVDWFLCGDNVWRHISGLKTYDDKHHTHYAADCATWAELIERRAMDASACHYEFTGDCTCGENSRHRQRRDAWAHWREEG